MNIKTNAALLLALTVPCAVAQAKPGNGNAGGNGKSWGQTAVPGKGALPAVIHSKKDGAPVREGWDKNAKHYAYGKGCSKTCKWHKHNNGKALGKDPVGKIIHKILH